MEYHCKYDELVAPSELKDNPRNVNRHPKKQLSALVNFIRFSGWRHPVVVSKRSGLIVAGHARKLAAIELGCDCPVVYQYFESDETERTFLHADNKLAELAELDVISLDLEVVELAELDVPVLDFGFDSKKIDRSDSIDIPDIEIGEKIALEKITVFAEEHIKKEVIAKLREIGDGYEDGLFRIVT